MENMIWINDQITPQLCKQLSGTFESSSDWSACTLKLQLGQDGVLKGQFQMGKQSLGVIGGISKSGKAFGFLLEPVASVPVALFRIKPGDTLSLELDVPDFDTLLDHCSPEQVRFERIAINKVTPQIDISPVDISSVEVKHVDISQSQTGVLATGGLK